MTGNPLDNALTKIYAEFDTPVDQFIGDPNRTMAFVLAVRESLGGQDLAPQQVMQRLVNLRKKGLLPRLRRSYHGRKVENN